MNHLEYKKINSKKILALILCSLVFFVFVFSFAPRAQAAPLITPVWEVLSPVNNKFGGIGEVVANIWWYLISACNSLVLVMLIAVAFMNILRIQLDSYAVKKILPSFIMAVILANFSFLICRVLIDFGNVAISIFLMGSGGGQDLSMASGPNQIASAFTTLLKEQPPSPGTVANYWGAIGAYTVKQILLLVGSGFVFVLAFLMLIRNYFLYFLVAISPVAFMAMFLPTTKKYFQQWWGQFTKWVFMPVASMFWLWIGGLLISEISKIQGDGGWLLTSIFAGFCFYMAVTSALKFDKAVGAWGGYGKQIWGKTGGQAVKGAQWMGNGGYASWRAFANQQKSVQAKALGLDKKAKIYDARANRWTKFNPRAWREGVKSRIDTATANAKKAPYKTPFYNSLAGRTAAIDANYQAGFESARNLTPYESGRSAVENLRATFSSLDPRYVQQMRILRDKRSREAAAAGVQSEQQKLNMNNDEYLDHLILADFDDKGANKLDVMHTKIGAKPLGDLKASADAYMKNLKRKETRDLTLEGFRLGMRTPSSAVPGQQPGQPSSGIPVPPPPNHGPDGRESLADVRRRQQREAAGREAEDATDEGRGETAGGRRGDMARVEELLEKILTATEKSGQSTEQMAAGISKTASGPNAGVGIAALPEIKGRMVLESLSPQAKAELGILQDNANRRANIIRQRLESRAAEQEIRALRTIKDGQEEMIRVQTEQGKNELPTREEIEKGIE